MSDQLTYKNLLFLLRGKINPLLLMLRRNPDFKIKDSILLFGNYRGGTTWIAEMLTTIPRTGIIFEPSHINVPEAKKAGLKSRFYLDENAVWPDGYDFFSKIITSELFNSWTTSELPITSALSIQSWIVKLIGCSTIAPWILNNFEVRKPVMIIRHPVAIYSSWIRRGWDHSSKYKLADKPFFDAYPKYQAIYDRVESPAEVFAMRWCIDQIVLLSLGDRIHRVCFEILQKTGPELLAPIFDSWKIPMPEGLEHAFRKPSTKVSSSFNAHKSGNEAYWKKHIDPKIINQMISIVNEFGLDFYSEDAEPDYGKLISFLPKLTGSMNTE